MPKKPVLMVFPTEWDEKHLESYRDEWSAEFEPIMAVPSDVDCPWDFDIVGYVETLVQEYGGRIAGVTSSSDYPGATVAGAVATKLGLPGTPPSAVIKCSHKYYSRMAQREVVPEATPTFHLINPAAPEESLTALTFPCFVKPVKGAFSIMSQKINDADELRAFFSRPSVTEFSTDYVAIFNQLVDSMTDLDIGGSFFVAEGFLNGSQVTVEGYVFDGAVEIIGIVDTVMHPGTGSFARFDYPSALRPEIQDAMTDIARKTITHLGLNYCLFNIEMIYEPSRDTIHIIEVNPRMCGQFADLYQKVDGTNSYHIALDLAVGRRPKVLRGAGDHALATSFPLRTFERVVVRKAPTTQQVLDVESRYDDALVWWECAEGQELADFERVEDGHSYRYAVINVGGDTRAELRATLAAIERDLGYQFEQK